MPLSCQGCGLYPGKDVWNPGAFGKQSCLQNLSLRQSGRRPGGGHDLAQVVCPVWFLQPEVGERQIQPHLHFAPEGWRMEWVCAPWGKRAQPLQMPLVSVERKSEDLLELTSFSRRWWQSVSEKGKMSTRKDMCQYAVHTNRPRTELAPVQELGMF